MKQKKIYNMKRKNNNNTMMKRFSRKALITLALLTSAVGAKAEDYVFMYNTYFLGSNTTTPTTSFVPNASIYSGANNSTFQNGNGYYIRYNNGLTFSTNQSTNFFLYNGYLVYSADGNYVTGYLNMQNPTTNARAWRISNSNNYRASYYEVISTLHSEGISNLTISGNASISTTGNYNYTHSTAQYLNTSYTEYNFNNLTYYSTDPANAASTSRPGTFTNIDTGYSWSLSDNAAGYATVNSSTGEVTVSSIPTSGNLTITLTCTATYNGQSATATKNITLTQTGVSGETVTIDDREDHNWSYYQASGNLPENYPTDYLSSPDPRNVKITYQGGGVSGGSAVAISALDGEGQNEMVYYKTMEKTVPGMTGNYPYTVISNPFSKRPKVGTNTYYGFAGWKVVSGGEYIQEYADGATLPLDVTIHFTNLDNNYIY